MFFFFLPTTFQLKFKQVLGKFREENPYMTVGTLHTLIYIAISAKENGTVYNMKAISRDLNVPYQTIVRNIAVLGSGSRREKGLMLIERVEGENGKEVGFRLTSRGRQFLDIEDEVSEGFLEG